MEQKKKKCRNQSTHVQNTREMSRESLVWAFFFFFFVRRGVCSLKSFSFFMLLFNLLILFFPNCIPPLRPFTYHIMRQNSGKAYYRQSGLGWGGLGTGACLLVWTTPLGKEKLFCARVMMKFTHKHKIDLGARLVRVGRRAAYLRTHAKVVMLRRFEWVSLARQVNERNIWFILRRSISYLFRNFFLRNSVKIKWRVVVQWQSNNVSKSLVTELEWFWQFQIILLKFSWLQVKKNFMANDLKDT